MTLKWIREQIRSGNYLWTFHADEERRNDGFDVTDVELAILKGKMLESYSDDPRGRSYLIFGKCRRQPIHVICGTNKQNQLVIITVYKPTLPKWKTPVERSQK